MSAHPSLTDQAYDEYLHQANKQDATSSSLVSLVLAHLPDKSSIRILDVGAGNGVIAQAVISACREGGRATSATLVEPNPHLQKALGERFGSDESVAVVGRKWPRAAPLLDSGFDVVLGANIAYHFSSQRALFQSLWGAVATGGVLCCTAATASTLEHPIYTKLLPEMMNGGGLTRTFSKLGRAACIEEINAAAFNLGVATRLTVVPADVRVTPADAQRGLAALASISQAAADSFCLFLSFALRITPRSLVQNSQLICEFAQNQQWAEQGFLMQAREGQLLSAK